MTDLLEQEQKQFFEEKILQASTTAYPSPISKQAFTLNDEEKIEQIAEHFSKILQILGLDLSNPSIEKTPQRVAKMYVKELFSGLRADTFPSLTFVEDFSCEEIISIKHVSLQSICEHHFLPMIGHAHIAYIPNKKIIGLSKINRLAQYFGKRPQLQERLSAQIADCLRIVLDTEHIAVFTQMKHFCVAMRGISDENSITETTIFHGKFRSDQRLRREVFSKKS